MLSMLVPAVLKVRGDVCGIWSRSSLREHITQFSGQRSRKQGGFPQRLKWYGGDEWFS